MEFAGHAAPGTPDEKVFQLLGVPSKREFLERSSRDALPLDLTLQYLIKAMTRCHGDSMWQPMLTTLRASQETETCQEVARLANLADARAPFGSFAMVFNADAVARILKLHSEVTASRKDRYLCELSTQIQDYRLIALKTLTEMTKEAIAMHATYAKTHVANAIGVVDRFSTNGRVMDPMLAELAKVKIVGMSAESPFPNAICKKQLKHAREWFDAQTFADENGCDLFEYLALKVYRYLLKQPEPICVRDLGALIKKAPFLIGTTFRKFAHPEALTGIWCHDYSNTMHKYVDTVDSDWLQRPPPPWGRSVPPWKQLRLCFIHTGTHPDDFADGVENPLHWTLHSCINDGLNSTFRARCPLYDMVYMAIKNNQCATFKMLCAFSEEVGRAIQNACHIMLLDDISNEDLTIPIQDLSETIITDAVMNHLLFDKVSGEMQRLVFERCGHKGRVQVPILTLTAGDLAVYRDSEPNNYVANPPEGSYCDRARKVLRSCVARNFHWEQIRRLVKCTKYMWAWVDMYEEKAGKSVMVNGSAVPVGKRAIVDHNEWRVMNGEATGTTEEEHERDMRTLGGLAHDPQLAEAWARVIHTKKKARLAVARVEEQGSDGE